MRITTGVKTDLRKLIKYNLKEWLSWLDDTEDECSNQLTVGLPNSGDEWSYQTGDNSYIGGAYCFPHWAVVSFDNETTIDELFSDLMEEIDNIEVYNE